MQGKRCCTHCIMVNTRLRRQACESHILLPREEESIITMNESDTNNSYPCWPICGGRKARLGLGSGSRSHIIIWQLLTCREVMVHQNSWIILRGMPFTSQGVSTIMTWEDDFGKGVMSVSRMWLRTSIEIMIVYQHVSIMWLSHDCCNRYLYYHDHVTITWLLYIFHDHVTMAYGCNIM